MTDAYRIRSAETWAQARDDYLSGMAAEAVCRRHDLGLSAFRRRARRCGWRRADQVPPPPGETDLSIYEDVEVDDQIATARLRFIEALDSGRATEARRWRRLWLELRAEVQALNAEMFPGETPAQIRALLAADAEERDQQEDEYLGLIPPSSESALLCTQKISTGPQTTEDRLLRNSTLAAP